MKWSITTTKEGKNYLFPFLLITSLFFMWGFAHSMLDVLNKHFQLSLNISMMQSALVQNAVYGGYFLMALPAGKLISRFGYRAGVLTGLGLFGLGALLFVPGSLLPSANLFSFYFFVGCLFILGCGLTCLETSANPYVTVLGAPEGAERRINFAQSFNGLGWILGPLVGIFLFRSGAQDDDVVLPYAVIGIIVWLAVFAFARVKWPEVGGDESKTSDEQVGRSLWQQRHFTLGLVALFLYVAAQTGINSFFINFTTTSEVGLSNQTATLLLSFGCMGLFMVGRLMGSWLMGRIRPERLLAFYALLAMGGTMLIVFFGGNIGVVALLGVYYCESIMFPTIFALSIRGLRQATKRASSYLIMTIVGGAAAPTLMAAIAEQTSMAFAFIVPLICFVVIFVYAAKYKQWGSGS